MKPFTTIASVIFALIAIAHTLRLIFGWNVTINNAAVPQWPSLVAIVLASALSVMICREGCCKPAAAAV